MYPWPVARYARATAERSSFVLPNTEPTRKYDEPDELPFVVTVLARRSWREGESYVCDRGEVVSNVEGVEAAVNLLASLRKYFLREKV